MEQQFTAIAIAMKQFPFDPVLSNSDKLQLYSLYKQATLGDNNQPPPSRMLLTAYQKWKAWKTCEGFTKETAQDAYIQFATQLMNDANQN